MLRDPIQSTLLLGREKASVPRLTTKELPEKEEGREKEMVIGRSNLMIP